MISTPHCFQVENRFWNLRPDGIVINKYRRTLHILDSLSGNNLANNGAARGQHRRRFFLEGASASESDFA